VSNVNERIVKAAGEKQLVTYKETTKTLNRFFGRNLEGQKRAAGYIQSPEKKTYNKGYSAQQGCQSELKEG